MTFEVYMIKGYIKGIWYFYHTTESNDPDRQWETNIYFADRFNTEKEAKEFLKNMIKVYHWGGYYRIEKYFLSR